MTVFLCILAFLATVTDIKIGEGWPGWTLPATFALKVVMVLGLAALALESYKL